jgi:hypothetical protein
MPKRLNDSRPDYLRELDEEEFWAEVEYLLEQLWEADPPEEA